MQATVMSFDPESRCGSVVLDDGTQLPYESAAFDAARLRFVRPGQRVRIRTDGEGASATVTFLTLATFTDSAE